MVKSFAVFGLGRFGRSVAVSLMETGADVMAIDRDESIIADIADEVTYAVAADVSDMATLKSLGIANMDAVIVAMGHDLEASIMSVMSTKELGVPYVLAKARDERMGDILKKVGADKVVYPEKETGSRIARKLVSSGILEFFDLSGDIYLVEIVPKDEWVGKTLIELGLRKKYNINVIGIKKDNVLTNMLDPNEPLVKDNTMLITIDKKNLNKLG